MLELSQKMSLQCMLCGVPVVAGHGAGVGGEAEAEARGLEGQGVGKEVEVRRQNDGFAPLQEESRRLQEMRGMLQFSWHLTLFLIQCFHNKKMYFLPYTTEEQWRVVLSLPWMLATERWTSPWRSRVTLLTAPILKQRLLAKRATRMMIRRARR